MTDKTWTPLPLLKTTAAFLEAKGVPTPRLDAEVLLCQVLGCASRIELFTGFERPLLAAELGRYRELVRRRGRREPVSRILGEREFMGIPFKVTPTVFSPRPETEILVEEVVRRLTPPKPKRSAAVYAKFEAALQKQQEGPAAASVEAPPLPERDEIPPAEADPVNLQASPPPSPLPIPETRTEETSISSPRVLDLGTGSGCIAVAVAALCPRTRVVATDISPAALAVARDNAGAADVNARVEFREGDLFAACRAGETFNLVLSNPPYLVAGDEAIWPEVYDYDPPEALYGGADGLAFYRRLAPEVEKWLNPGGVLLLEVGAGQAAAVTALLRAQAGLEDIHALRDYLGVERVVVARKR